VLIDKLENLGSGMAKKCSLNPARKFDRKFSTLALASSQHDSA